jgi:hypothetical protein
LQLPLQLASHFASQVAEGGVPVHSASQLPLHVALQDASHSLLLPDDEHLPLQSPSQLARQLAEQSSEPGFASHCPVQLPLHEA